MNGCSAQAPVHTPVFGRSVDCRSISVASRVACTYACTVARCSAVVIASTSGCSGASTMYVAPKTVSTRVVKTVIASQSGAGASSAKRISAPSERPIQFVCIVRIRSGHSSDEKSSSSSAYCVIRKNHCSRSRISTTDSQRSQCPTPSSPRSTCSLASTVWQPGHQFAGAILR